jgi:FAD/FMN-containing dehydrogenase
VIDLINRRQFLRLTGQLALGAGLASQLAWAGGYTWGKIPSEADWQKLARRLKGRLLLPGDIGYQRARLPFNRRYANIYPAGIALCAGAADVRESILWSRDYEIPIVARSGGHSYGGYSTTPGLIIDLSNLKRIKVNEREGLVSISAGARNTNIYSGLQPYAVAVPAGRCPTVGVSGLVLGGGFGFSSRKLGLMSDTLVETEIVTADGRLLVCNEDENSDLFWACRGGGGGNFGINTSFTCKTFPVGNVSIYRLAWDWDDAAEVLVALQEIVPQAPDEFSLRLGLGAVGAFPGAGRRSAAISITGQYFGPKEKLAELLDPVVSVATPTTVLIEDRTFWQAKNFFFNTTPRDRFVEKSNYLNEPLPDRAIATLLKWVERWPGSSNSDGGGAAMFAWGGAMNRVPADATAFIHRDALFLLVFGTSWGAEDSRRAVRANRRWIEEFYDAMQPYVSDQAYQNFIDPALRNWQQAYYGANFERLVEVKQSYDPDDVFHFAQSIPTQV